MQELILASVFIFFADTTVVQRWQLEEILFKIIIPSLVVISVKLATMAQTDRKISFFTIITTAIIGIGTAYFCSGLILKYTENEWSVFTAGVITYSSEHISRWFLYRMKFDIIGDAFIDFIRRWIDGRTPK